MVKVAPMSPGEAFIRPRRGEDSDAPSRLELSAFAAGAAVDGAHLPRNTQRWVNVDPEHLVEHAADLDLGLRLREGLDVFHHVVQFVVDVAPHQQGDE